MNKKIKDEFQDTVCDNNDYFFRDNEMARCNMENINHQVDPTYNEYKEKKGKQK